MLREWLESSGEDPDREGLRRTPERLREAWGFLTSGYREEIAKIAHAVSAGGYTLIPLKLYFSDGRAKVEIALAKGQRAYDKRQTLRERKDTREADRAMRLRNRVGV